MIETVPVKIPKIFKGIHNPYRYKVFYGGRGSGKSQSVARYLLLAGKEQKLKILCAREYQTSIKESVKQLLEELIQELKLDQFYKVQTGEIIGVNGTSFIFAGLHHNIANIKSMHDVNKCWVEEAQVVSDFSWSILIPTIRAEGSEIILTMNPELEEDPTYQRFIADPPPNALIVKVNYTDNPYFTSVLEAEKELLKRKNYEAYLHIWEGKPLSAVEGAIYAQQLQKAADEGRIGKFPYDDRYPVSAIADIGWNDFTSWWFLQFVNHRPRLIATYQNQFQKTPHYVDVMQQMKYRYDRIVLPHDAENEHANADRTWLQIFKQSFPNANVYAGKRQSIELRLEAAKNMFDLFDFDKVGTADGRSALAHYHYATDPQTKKLTREPFHGPESNYCFAGETKVLTQKGWKRIDRIKAGEKAWTPSGYALITAAGETKKTNRLLEVTFSNGAVIRCTPEHKIFTERGLVCADALRYTDIILCKNHPALSLLPLMDSSIGCRDNITALKIGDAKTFPRRCIERYGFPKTEKSHLDTKCIIKTGTHSTIQSTISLSGISVSTEANIKREGGLKDMWNTKPLGRKQLNYQKNGTEVRWGFCGIVNMGKRHGKTGRQFQRHVRYVGGNIKLSFLTVQDSATRIVSKKIIHEESEKPVYDLTVEKHHCFLAENILVSNCDAFGYMCLEMKEPSKPKEKKHRSIYSGM